MFVPTFRRELQVQRIATGIQEGDEAEEESEIQSDEQVESD